MNKVTTKIMLIDNNSPKLADGQIGMTKSRWRKLQERQRAGSATLLVVCGRCWLNERFKARAHIGTMISVGKDSSGDTKYEHQACPMQGGGK